MAGNPGSTARLLTADQLLSLRDFVLPETLLLLSEFRGRLIEFGQQGPEQQRIADRELFGVENSFKALLGPVSGPGAARFHRGQAQGRRGAARPRRRRSGAGWANRRSLGGDRRAPRVPAPR